MNRVFRTLVVVACLMALSQFAVQGKALDLSAAGTVVGPYTGISNVNGAISGATTINASGTITGITVSDGAGSTMTGGVVTGYVLSDGAGATMTGGTITGGTLTGGTLTDGTASLTGGALTGVTTINASGAITGGNLATAGTLGVAGWAYLNSASVTNNATVGTTLAVGGLATLMSASIVNNATVGGTLGVTGNTSLSTLNTSGLAYLNSASILNNATVGGYLGVNGNATVNGGTTINGLATLNNGASIAGGINNNFGGITNAGAISGVADGIARYDAVNRGQLDELESALRAAIAALAAIIADTTPPSVNSVTVSPSMAAAGDSLHAVVDATDPAGVSSVTADGATLTKTGASTWAGELTAAPTLGVHAVAVSAADVRGNTTNTTGSYKTAAIRGMAGRCLTDSIMAPASSGWLFRIWGKVAETDDDNFTLDDGSAAIRVHAPGYKSKVHAADYASARGVLHIDGGARWIESAVGFVTKQ